MKRMILFLLLAGTAKAQTDKRIELIQGKVYGQYVSHEKTNISDTLNDTTMKKSLLTMAIITGTFLGSDAQIPGAITYLRLQNYNDITNTFAPGSWSHINTGHIIDSTLAVIQEVYTSITSASVCACTIDDALGNGNTSIGKNFFMQDASAGSGYNFNHLMSAYHIIEGDYNGTGLWGLQLLNSGGNTNMALHDNTGGFNTYQQAYPGLTGNRFVYWPDEGISGSLPGGLICLHNTQYDINVGVMVGFHANVTGSGFNIYNNTTLLGHWEPTQFAMYNTLGTIEEAGFKATSTQSNAIFLHDNISNFETSLWSNPSSIGIVQDTFPKISGRIAVVSEVAAQGTRDSAITSDSAAVLRAYTAGRTLQNVTDAGATTTNGMTITNTAGSLTTDGQLFWNVLQFTSDNSGTSTHEIEDLHPPIIPTGTTNTYTHYLPSYSGTLTGCNIQESADYLAQTTGLTLITSVIPTGLHKYRITGNFNITANSLDSLQFQVFYYDNNGANASRNLVPENDTHVWPTVGNITQHSFSIDIWCQGNGSHSFQINASLVSFGGSITFDATASIIQLK